MAKRERERLPLLKPPPMATIGSIVQVRSNSDQSNRRWFVCWRTKNAAARFVGADHDLSFTLGALLAITSERERVGGTILIRFRIITAIIISTNSISVIPLLANSTPTRYDVQKRLSCSTTNLAYVAPTFRANFSTKC